MHERGRSDREGAEEPFLECLQVMRDDRQMIIHEPGEAEREGLPADNYVLAHHEYTEQNQHGAIVVRLTVRPAEPSS